MTTRSVRLGGRSGRVLTADLCGGRERVAGGVFKMLGFRV